MRTSIDHVAIAVPSLERALDFLRALGLEAGATEEIPRDKVRVAMVPVGGGRVEVMETTDPEGPVGRFLGRRGPGLHHVAFRVEDLEAVLEGLKARGIRLVDLVPRPGSGGTTVAFVHPEGTGGALVELLERGGGESVEP